MRMYDIIRDKRDGKELSEAQIRFFIEGYTAGDIPDYQASALMMAIYFKGMTEQETVILTDAMARSGDMVDLSRFGTKSVDKHSTGGVGDKTSLIVAPIVAALGGKVTKMSGRGLGHTGGTVDKLESINGYKTDISSADFLSQIENVGMAIIGQSGNLTPADKMLYALRDVTATVDSIPLITSSIMSKKIAAGSHNIVLDVKVGSGAFMKTLKDAEALAFEMVKIGKGCGRKVAAVLTNMDTPLGTNIGNSLEVIEAVEILKGNIINDLSEVCIILAAQMVSLCLETGIDEAENMVREAILSGKAYEKCKEWIASQGGDVRLLDNPSLFKQPLCSFEVKANKSGYIVSMDAEKIGNTATVLGAGRKTKSDVIDYSAGIILKAKTGDYVNEGDILCTLYTDNEFVISNAAQMYLDAIALGDTKQDPLPLVYKTVK